MQLRDGPKSVAAIRTGMEELRLLDRGRWSRAPLFLST
jgi:hypothetical protein